MDVSRLMTSNVRHRDQDVRVHALKNEGRFYFPLDYRIERSDMFHWDGSSWLVVNVFRGPNATSVEAWPRTDG